jgi:predicted  nucleic acid-binding Zn-ribbon protein
MKVSIERVLEADEQLFRAREQREEQAVFALQMMHERNAARRELTKMQERERGLLAEINRLRVIR